jgi:hypothetical protein
MTEALGAEQGGFGATAFDEGIDHQRRAMDEALHLADIDGRGLHRLLQPIEHGQSRVVMRRQHLAEMHMAVGIKQRYVGKCAANIGSNS